MKTTPGQSVSSIEKDPRLVPGTDERFTGYGVMGVPYASGHYLVLRDMLASSIGAAYRAIWHRDPTGRWTIFTTADPKVSCPRYFGAATYVEQVPVIEVSWRDDWSVYITMGTRLSWTLVLESTTATRMMTAVGGTMPPWAWNKAPVLGSMGPMAGVILGSGRVKLHGRTPNGQDFKAAPQQVWGINNSDAELDGVNFGPLGRLAEQTRLGDFWMPQRGLFFVGQARFTEPAASPARRHDRGATRT